MSTTVVPSPTSLVRFGHARVDVTPPVGIYHRLWGAARHDRASGVHRPLAGDVMVFAPLDGVGDPLVRCELDLAGLVQGQHDAIAESLARAAGVPRDRVVITYSHTHSSGWFVPDRWALPGGELIPAYLADLEQKMHAACLRAVERVSPATITYATGRCDLAANRDYWDADRGAFACGFNPDAAADDTVIVARVSDASGAATATIVNYGCHPTTLAWDNALISPDYVGAMREEVERATGVPCVFTLGACGDLGPSDGFVGDTAVADRNGRRLGYAALSALTSMGPPATDFAYAGPVVSGATLGTWRFVPLEGDRRAAAARFDGGASMVALPLKPFPDQAALRDELDGWEAEARNAIARGDALAGRDARALAERARRWLARLDDLPSGPTFPLDITVARMGDAVWVTCGGEPYSLLQQELRRRFPSATLLVSPLAGDLRVAYLLPRDRYGHGLYQEEPSILAPGCLETLIEALAQRIAAVLV